MNRSILLILALLLLQASNPAKSSDTNFDLMAATAVQPRKVNPLYYSGTGMPALSQYTRTSTDPAKDQTTGHLDLVADYFTFSGTKFYAAIQNRGGGFPFTGALGFPPYYSYMYLLADPAADPKDPNTIVWALCYMKVTLGGIKPGLFKINGTGADDLIRLGEITHTIDRSNNLLKMSCDIAPLMADPDFRAWYNPANPVIGTGSLTSRTTLKGLTPVPQETDTSPGAWVYPRRLYNQLNPQTLPSTGNYGFHWAEKDDYFQITITNY